MSGGTRYAAAALALVVAAWAGAAFTEEEQTAWDRYTEAGYADVESGDLEAAAENFGLAYKETEELGSDDPLYATSLANLGWVYALQRRYAEAKVLYREAYAARRKTFGPTHQVTLRTQDEFAETLQRLGEHDLAEDLFRAALETREKTLGENHPDVATSLENLARLYREQERYAEVQPLLERAIAVREAVYGARDPKVHALLERLSEVHERQGRIDEAVRVYERALTLTEQSLPPGHPFVAGMLERFAELLREAGKDEDADEADARAMDIRARTEHMGPPEPLPEP